MSKTTLVKGALVMLLVAVAMVSPASDSSLAFRWIRPALLVFGVLNVLVTVPGSQRVRAVAIAAVVGSLLWPAGLQGVTMLLAVLLWGPALMIAWANSAENMQSVRVLTPEGEAAALQARITVAVVIGGAAIASIGYRAIVAHNLQQTSALFIGLPALLAIVVVMGTSPRSATGVAFKAVTVMLLASFIFLWEGALCVVLSAPLFYGVAGAIAASIDTVRRRRDHTSTTVLSCLMVLAVAPMSLEGVAPWATANRDQSVSASQVVHAAPGDIERALLAPPRFERGRPRPLFLRLGFPTPAGSRIERGAGSMRWVVQLRGGEMLLNGMESRTGNLVLDLEETGDGFLRWRAVSDTSHMTHFLLFRESMVRWEAIDAQTTRVTWTLRYERNLDPAWYFGPMERYAARLAAGYLIDAIATP